MSDLDYIADAMIEASGALHVTVTDSNHVYNIIQKLDRAICKARALKSQDLIPKSEALSYIGSVVSDLPPPVPTQETPPLDRADQSPSWSGFPLQSGPTYVSVGGNPNVYEIDDDAKTRIVHRHPTDDGSPIV